MKCNYVVKLINGVDKPSRTTVQLDLNFKKLACALHAALHEPKNIRCVSASAREGDDVSTTRGE